MPSGKFVSYSRVSTFRQGQSGLGLEAQKKAISDYLNGGSWELLGEFVEVESGKKNDRQELQKALHLCRMTGATLVIAKLDRLSRNLNFITSLQQSGIEFTACDMPQANRFTINVIAAVAQHEREMTSQRTIVALAAAKARGKVLGNPANLSPDAAAKGRKLAATANRQKAIDFANKIKPVIEDFRSQNLNLRQIAEELNNRNILSASGKIGRWSPTTVRDVVLRLNSSSANPVVLAA